MPKNIVLFSDGTGNSPGKLFKTNVWRVYQALDLVDPAQLPQPRQFALYDNGVGNSSFKPLALLGGAIGLGLARNVRELYAFLCRVYEPGDKIYAFGFSRGAFTIRVLVGMILNQGLVPYRGNEAELERLSVGAYRAYRRCKYDVEVGSVNWLRDLRDRFIAWRDRRAGRTPYRQVAKTGAPRDELPPERDPDAIHITFLGLWDTVDAYGLPIDELTRLIDRFVWPLTMRDLHLNPRVDRACHALALDDERNTFHPRLWDESEQDRVLLTPRASLAGERISQVWFAGVHANVGGGYPDDSLAHVPLRWIMDEAERCGLRFTPKSKEDLYKLSDENGPIYDSRHGLAGYYRYNPRRLEALTWNDQVKIARPKVHESVLRRIRVGQDAYAPIVLPPDVDVLSLKGDLVSVKHYLGDNAALTRGGAYADGREHVFTWVCWRRIAYFATLIPTLVLVALPLPTLISGASLPECSGWLCRLQPLIEWLAEVPGVPAKWVHWYAAHPEVLAAMGALIVTGLTVGGRLERRIRDTMRPLWYGITAARPAAVRHLAPEPPVSALNRWLERTRLQWGAKFATRRWAHGLLPVVLVIAFGLGGSLLV